MSSRFLLPISSACVIAACSLLAVDAAPALAAHRAGRPVHVCVTQHGRLVAQSGRCGHHEVTLRLRPARGASTGSSVVTTCVNRHGSLRVISRGRRCKRGERKLTWSVEGPRGPSGPEGNPRLLVPFEIYLEYEHEAIILNEAKLKVTLRCGSAGPTYNDELVVEPEEIAHAVLQVTSRAEEEEFKTLRSEASEVEVVNKTLEGKKATVVASRYGGGLAPYTYQGFVTGFIQAGSHAALIDMYWHAGDAKHDECQARGAYMITPATPFPLF